MKKLIPTLAALMSAVLLNSASGITITPEDNSFHQVYYDYYHKPYADGADFLGSLSQTHAGTVGRSITNLDDDDTFSHYALISFEDDGDDDRVVTQASMKFTITESVRYVITGAIGIHVRGVQLIETFAFLANTSDLSLVHSEREYFNSSNRTLVTQSVLDDQIGSDASLGYVEGAHTGIIGPGTYDFFSKIEFNGYGNGSASGTYKLQLFEIEDNAGVPDTGSTCALLGFSLLGLLAINRKNQR